MRAACKAEVLELHQFFQQWFTGAAPPESFSRVEAALAADFELIDPAGRTTSREELLHGLRHAAHRHVPGGFAIDIENVRVRAEAAEIAVITYDEWQTVAGEMPWGRVSTAVFRAREGCPNGVEWLYLQETWANEARGVEHG